MIIPTVGFCMKPHCFFLFDKLLYSSTANYFSCISVEAVSQMQRLNESQNHYKTSAVKM